MKIESPISFVVGVALGAALSALLVGGLSTERADGDGRLDPGPVAKATSAEALPADMEV